MNANLRTKCVRCKLMSLVQNILYYGGINSRSLLVVTFMAMVVCLMSSGIVAAEEVKLTLAGSYDTAGNTRTVALSGNYAYVADESNGLVIVDISNPAAPVLVGRSNDTKDARGVAISGNYAYVADHENGLVIVDISNSVAPVLVGSYDTAGWGTLSVAVLGRYAYVFDYYNGLVIVDISNPTAPVFVGSYDTEDSAYGVTVLDNYAYIAHSRNGLVIIDISNPTTPVIKGSYDTKDARGVVVSDNYAYVADLDDGLVIVDISNPTIPVFAGSYYTGSARGIAVSGNYAYVTNLDGSLVIVDISNPIAPVIKDSYDTADLAYGVTVSGKYAYVADGAGGLVVLNIAKTGLIDVPMQDMPMEAAPIEKENLTNTNIVVAIFALLIFGIIVKNSNNSSKNTTPFKSMTSIKSSTSNLASTLIPKENGPINIISAFSYKGAKILYKTKVENSTLEPIADIKVNLYVPDVFLVSESIKTIVMLKPGESKTATFEIRPTGECGDCEISGKVVYYDYSTKKTSDIEIPAKNLSIVCPMLRVKEISESEWHNIVSNFVETEESTRDIDIPAETLFTMVSRIVKDMHMYPLNPEITDSPQLYNGVARFYGEGVKGLKYAAQIEVIGGAKKSKLIMKTWAEKEEALTGFYHGLIDEIEKRVQVKGYINDSIVQNYYHNGDNIGTQVKDSFVQRSNIGIGADAKKCPNCNRDVDANEMFCLECGTKL